MVGICHFYQVTIVLHFGDNEIRLQEKTFMSEKVEKWVIILDISCQRSDSGLKGGVSGRRNGVSKALFVRVGDNY
jgi:hypothetical protein